LHVSSGSPVASGPLEPVDDDPSLELVEPSPVVSSGPLVVVVVPDVSPAVDVSTNPDELLVDAAVVVGSTPAVVSLVDVDVAPVVGPTVPPVLVPPSSPVTVDELVVGPASPLSSPHPATIQQQATTARENRLNIVP